MTDGRVEKRRRRLSPLPPSVSNASAVSIATDAMHAVRTHKETHAWLRNKAYQVWSDVNGCSAGGSGDGIDATGAGSASRQASGCQIINGIMKAPVDHTPWCDPEFPAVSESISGKPKSTKAASSSSNTPPRCRCGQVAQLRKVIKATANQGRPYYTCAAAGAGGGRGCGFFVWADAGSRRTAKYCWKRFSGYVVVTDFGFTANDLRQGGVGDCWFLSALAVVAERHDLIAKLFADTATSPVGCYCVRFFMDGGWQSVVVDDQLPCSGSPRRPEQVFDTGLAFSRAANNQLWVCLLEKAYAKVHGSYHAISGGEIAEALLDLTGAPTVTINFDKPGFSINKLWDFLLWCKSAQLPMGCATDSDPLGQLRDVGLCPTHAYSILECREVTRNTGECVRLLRIRNPHGVGEWIGDWSDNSYAWSEVISACDNHGPERTGVNDGTFWMELIQFVQAFALVDVCCAFRDWYSHSFPNTFCAKSSVWRVCDKFYRISCDQKTQAYFMVLQPTKRGAWCRDDRKTSYKPGDLFITIAEFEGNSLENSNPSVRGFSITGPSGRGDTISVDFLPGKRYVAYVHSLGSSPTAAEVTQHQPFTVRVVSEHSLCVQEENFLPARDGPSSVLVLHNAFASMITPRRLHRNFISELMEHPQVEWRELGNNRAVILLVLGALVVVIGINRSSDSAKFSVIADCKVMAGRGIDGQLKSNTEGRCKQRADTLNNTVVQQKGRNFGSGFRYPAKWKCYETEGVVLGCNSDSLITGHQRLLLILVGTGVQSAIGKIEVTAHATNGKSNEKITKWITSKSENVTAAQIKNSHRPHGGVDWGEGIFATVPLIQEFIKGHGSGPNYQVDTSLAEAEEASIATAICESTRHSATVAEDEALQMALVASMNQQSENGHDKELSMALAASAATVTEEDDMEKALKLSLLQTSKELDYCVSPGICVSKDDEELNRALHLSLQHESDASISTKPQSVSAVVGGEDEDEDIKQAINLSLQTSEEPVQEHVTNFETQLEPIYVDSDSDDDRTLRAGPLTLEELRRARIAALDARSKQVS